MKVLRKIVGKTKTDRIRSQPIREFCGIKSLNEWVERSRREWDQHVSRMDTERLVKISWDLSEDLQDALKKDGGI